MVESMLSTQGGYYKQKKRNETTSNLNPYTCRSERR